MYTSTGNTTPSAEEIPMINRNVSADANAEVHSSDASQPAHDRHHLNDDIEADADHLDGEDAPPDEALPEYKEHDMAEPLPPYMARVRQVIRGQEPMSTIMPNKRVGMVIVGGFVIVVLIIIGVSVGVTVAGNKNGSNNNNNNQ